MELDLSTLQPVVQERGLGTRLRDTEHRLRGGAFAPGFDDHSYPSTCCGQQRGREHQLALGRSQGGWSTKIHAAVNDQGIPVRFALSGGERHDLSKAESLIDKLSPDYVVADKGYDSDPLREQIRCQGAKPVIPSRRGYRRRRHDRTRYKFRNIIERFFNRLKNYRRVATRYDKKDRNFFGFVCLAALVISHT